MKYILVTGVSSGIGYDIVRHFVSIGYFVFGSIRKPADLERLESDFPERFKGLLFDIGDREAIQKSAGQVQEILNGQLLTCLVNNAGIALAGPLELIDDEAFDHQLLVNVGGTRNVINAFLPMLGASLDRSARDTSGKDHQQQFDLRRDQYADQRVVQHFQARDRESWRSLPPRAVDVRHRCHFNPVRADCFKNLDQEHRLDGGV